MRTGKLWNCTRAEYEADREHLRSTQLKDFLHPERGPWYYKAAYLDGSLRADETDDMLLGRLVHEYVLEGMKSWVTWNKGRRQGADWEVFRSAHCDVPIVNRDHGIVNERRIEAIREAVLANTEARRLIEGAGFSEQAIRWTEAVESSQAPITPILCKALIDRLGNDGTLADLKVTSNVIWHGFFSWHIVRMMAHVSAAYYQMARDSVLGESRAPFVWITVTSDAPYRCICYEAPWECLDLGRRQCELGLKQLARCRALDQWPDALANRINRPRAERWWIASHEFPVEEWSQP